MTNTSTKSSPLLILSIVFFLFSLITTIVVVAVLVTKSSGKACNYEGTTYNNLEAFTNDCNSCTCQDGEIQCTTMACSGDSEDELFNYPDENLDDTTEEDTFDEGERTEGSN